MNCKSTCTMLMYSSKRPPCFTVPAPARSCMINELPVELCNMSVNYLFIHGDDVRLNTCNVYIRWRQERTQLSYGECQEMKFNDKKRKKARYRYRTPKFPPIRLIITDHVLNTIPPSPKSTHLIFRRSWMQIQAASPVSDLVVEVHVGLAAVVLANWGIVKCIDTWHKWLDLWYLPIRCYRPHHRSK